MPAPRVRSWTRVAALRWDGGGRFSYTQMPFGQSPASVDAWRFPADIEPAQVVDGDTTDCEVDLGFRVSRRVRIRLYGVDTAEVYGVEEESAEYAAGKEQSEFTRQWVRDARDGSEWPFTVWCQTETGAYGRWIADVERRDTGESLTSALREAFPDLG